jgi:hypothetical protein
MVQLGLVPRVPSVPSYKTWCPRCPNARHLGHSSLVVVLASPGTCATPSHPPAHHDKTVMNGAQLPKTQGDSDDRATCRTGTAFVALA